MKKLVLVSSIMLFGFLAKSQDYTTAFGLRGGLGSGFTIKHFISGTHAVEGIVSSRYRGFNVTGLYEVTNALPTAGLNWYYGGGAHIGFWHGKYANPWFTENRSYTVIGVDGILGIEYTFLDLPINISLDWKPAVNLIGYTGFWGDAGAFSIRYTIK